VRARLVSVTDHPNAVVVRVHGALDATVAAQVETLVSDYLARGGSIETIALDLRSSERCATDALERIAGLVSVGLRLCVADPPRQETLSGCGSSAVASG
jgi:anti-anti-sigma regulatory factor